MISTLRNLGWRHGAALLVAGSSVLVFDSAQAQTQNPSGLSESLPMPKAAAKPGTETAAAAAKPDAVPSEAVQQKYDKAFAESLEKPADPDTLVKFAEAAVEFGDIEGAISALERLLLIDSNQPEVKLELGVLYYRLGSAEVARAYLEEVSASKESSDDEKERANTFLKELKKP